jgi:hypothetical protein
LEVPPVTSAEFRTARTLYACVAEHETELSFEPNQIITRGTLKRIAWHN